MSRVRKSQALAAVEELPEPHHRALRDFIAASLPRREGVGEVLALVMTRSELPAAGLVRGLLGSSDTEDVAAVLTPDVLFIIAAVNGAEPAVSTVRLLGAEVTDYADTGAHKMIPDSGVQIIGHPVHGDKRRRLFLGLGPDTEAFREALAAAV